jgi:hypothetical protein
MTAPRTFTSLDSYTVTGHGRVFVVANPETCDEFAHLLGPAIIDGLPQEVVAVERYAHRGPHPAGEAIGLLVKE